MWWASHESLGPVGAPDLGSSTSRVGSARLVMYESVQKPVETLLPPPASGDTSVATYLPGEKGSKVFLAAKMRFAEINAKLVFSGRFPGLTAGPTREAG